MAEELMKRARAWAIENGLTGKLRVGTPTWVDYPQYGHGFHLTVAEEEGKKRSASAHFRSDGEPNMWSMDGRGGLV